MPDAKLAQDIDRHVATRLRERRTTLGLTQQQVAEMLGITYQQRTSTRRASTGSAPGGCTRSRGRSGSSPATSTRGWARASRPGRPPGSGRCSSWRAASPRCPGGSRRRSASWPARSRAWRRPPPPDLAGRRPCGYPGRVPHTLVWNSGRPSWAAFSFRAPPCRALVWGASWARFTSSITRAASGGAAFSSPAGRSRRPGIVENSADPAPRCGR